MQWVSFQTQGTHKFPFPMRILEHCIELNKSIQNIAEVDIRAITSTVQGAMKLGDRSADQHHMFKYVYTSGCKKVV